MELLNILINPKKTTDVCCLCYKQSDKTTNFDDLLEIHDEYFDFHLSLGNIFKNLFPTHNILLAQACEDCSFLMTKMFCLLHKNYVKNEIFNSIICQLNQNMEDIEYKIVFGKELKSCRFKLDLPTTKNIMEIDKHILTKKYDCKKCTMKFKSKLLLKKHVHIAHKITNNAVICDQCGKMFTKNSLLKLHLASHKTKQCPYCLKSFKSHSHFNLHVKNHNTPLQRKRQPKYHFCNHCDYQSINKLTLLAHINKMHLNIKPYICSICQKGFYKKCNLTQHIDTHKNIKNKTCHICGATFYIEKTLQEHLKLHSGVKPYRCEFCQQGFITSGRRLEHVKRKHLEKTECCIVCGKKFSLKKDVNAHLKKVHGSSGNVFSFVEQNAE